MLTAALLVAEPVGAQTDSRNLLPADGRMARAGRWVWLVSYQGELLARDLKARTGGWQRFPERPRGGVAAVAFQRGGATHQRVIYAVQDGSQWYLEVLRLRDGMRLGTQRSPALPHALQDGPVAAVADLSTASPRLTVAMGTADGRLCITQWTDGYGVPVPSCTGAGELASPARSADLAASSAYRFDGQPPFFYYRRASGELARAVLWSWWGGSTVGVDPLGAPPGESAADVVPSVAAVSGPAGDWLLVGTRAGHLHALVLETSGARRWHPLPTLPSGHAIDAWRRASLAATRWSFYQWWSGTVSDQVTLFARDQHGHVFRLDSFDGPDPARWRFVGSPPPYDDPLPAQRWLAMGPAEPYDASGWGVLTSPVLWGTLGSELRIPASWRWPAVSLARLRAGRVDEFLFPTQSPSPSPSVLGRPFSTAPDPSPSYWPATEGNLDAAGAYGLAVAIRRRYPWRILLSRTVVGGASFSPSYEVAPSQAWGANTADVAMSDPFVAYDPATSRFHFIAIETRLSGDQSRCERSGPVQAIVYRSAAFPSTLAQAAPLPSFDATAARTYDCDANGGACVVGSPRFPGLVGGGDHGALVLTPSGSGPGAPATPHVVLWHYLPSGDRAVYHWWKPEGLPPRIERIDGDLGLALGPPSAFVDAAGDLYAYTFTVSGSGAGAYPFLCRIDPTGASGARPGQCDQRSDYRGRLTPSDMTPAVVQPELKLRANPSVRFQTWEPFAFAAHPNVAGRLYAVFPGGSSSRGPARIHFTWHQETATLDLWEPTVIIDPGLPAGPGEAWTYFDPEISVDRAGAIVVTFSGARVDAADPTALLEDRVRLFVAVSTDEGRSFTVHGYPPSELSWQPSALPRHCSRAVRFLGEYRRPVARAGRHLHLLPFSANGSPVHYTARFVSPFALAP